MKYNPNKEIKVDINDPKIKRVIYKSRKTYKEFAKRFIHRLDLSHPESVRIAYEKVYF